MSDPKSSVLTYIAENLPPDHRQQGTTPSHHTQSSAAYVPPNGNSAAYVPSSHPENQYQQGQPSSISQSFIQPNAAVLLSLSPSINAQLAQGMHSPLMHPQVVSNPSRQATPELLQPGAQQPQELVQTSFSRPLVQQEGTGMVQQSMYQQDPRSRPSEMTSQNHCNEVSSGHSMLSPPPAGPRKKSSPQSAQRLYHRIILDFETSKIAFFAARSRRCSAFPNHMIPNQNVERNNQEIVSLAYQLEALAHRLWSLRYEHSWEFEGCNDAGHQAIISYWQAEYGLWSDTVLDIQESGSGINTSNTAIPQVFSSTPANATVRLPQYPDGDDTVQQGSPMQLQSPPLKDATDAQGVLGRQTTQSMQLQHPPTPNSQAGLQPPNFANNGGQQTHGGQQQQQLRPWELHNQNPNMPQRGPPGRPSSGPNERDLPRGVWSNLENGNQAPSQPSQSQLSTVIPGMQPNQPAMNGA